MIQTCEPKPRTAPARRRSSAPLPVLISIPNIAPATRTPKGRVRRRRLRREVRIVGYALLIVLPLSMALATFAGDRRSFPVSGKLVVDHQASAAPAVELQAPVSLSPLEPIATFDREERGPVILPGVVIPVDDLEEPSDGGH